jgi:hypothetical protein
MEVQMQMKKLDLWKMAMPTNLEEIEKEEPNHYTYPHLVESASRGHQRQRQHQPEAIALCSSLATADVAAVQMTEVFGLLHAPSSAWGDPLQWARTPPSFL